MVSFSANPLTSDAAKYSGAIAKGVVRGVADTINTCLHPLETIASMSNLVRDTTVLVSAHGITPNPVQFYLKQNPQVYTQSAASMVERVVGVRQAGIDFLDADGLEQLETATAVVAGMVIPVPTFKGAGAAYQAARNIKKFGTPTEPPQFSSLISVAPLMKFKPWTTDYIKSTQGELFGIYVITGDNQLIIHPAMQTESGFPRVTIHPQLTQSTGSKPVLAAGDCIFHDGELKRIDDRTGSYHVFGEHLRKLVERSFTKRGFKEATGKFRFIGATKRANSNGRNVIPPPPVNLFPTGKQFLQTAPVGVALYPIQGSEQKDQSYFIDQIGKQLPNTSQLDPYGWMRKTPHQKMDHLIAAAYKVYDQNQHDLNPKAHRAFQATLSETIPDSQLTPKGQKEKQQLLQRSQAALLKQAKAEKNPTAKLDHAKQYGQGKAYLERQERYLRASNTHKTYKDQKTLLPAQLQKIGEWVDESDVSNAYLEEIGISKTSELHSILAHSATFQLTAKQFDQHRQAKLDQMQLRELSANLGHVAHVAGVYGQHSIQKVFTLTQAMVHGYDAALTTMAAFTGAKIALGTLAGGFVGMAEAAFAIAGYITTEEPEENHSMEFLFNALQEMHTNIIFEIRTTFETTIYQIDVRHDQLRRLLTERFDNFLMVFENLETLFDERHRTVDQPLLASSRHLENALNQLTALVPISSLRLLVSEFETDRNLAGTYLKGVVQKPISDEKFIELMTKLDGWANRSAKDPLVNGLVYLPKHNDALNHEQNKDLLVSVIKAFEQNPSYIVGLLGSFYNKKRTPLSNPAFLIPAVKTYIQLDGLRPDLEFDLSSNSKSLTMVRHIDEVLDFIHSLQNDIPFFKAMIGEMEKRIETINRHKTESFQNKIQEKAEELMERFGQTDAKTEINYTRGIWANPSLKVGDFLNILGVHIPNELMLAQDLGWKIQCSYSVIDREESDLFSGIGEKVRDVHDTHKSEQGAIVGKVKVTNFSREKWDNRVATLKRHGVNAKVEVIFTATEIKPLSSDPAPIKSFSGKFHIDMNATPQKDPETESVTHRYFGGWEVDSYQGNKVDHFPVKLWNERSPLNYKFSNVSPQNEVDFNQNVKTLTTWAKRIQTQLARADLQTAYTHHASGAESALVDLDYLSHMTKSLLKFAGFPSKTYDSLPDRAHCVTELQNGKNISSVPLDRLEEALKTLDSDSLVSPTSIELKGLKILLDAFHENRDVSATLDYLAEMSKPLEEVNVEPDDSDILDLLLQAAEDTIMGTPLEIHGNPEEHPVTDAFLTYVWKNGDPTTPCISFKECKPISFEGYSAITCEDSANNGVVFLSELHRHLSDNFIGQLALAQVVRKAGEMCYSNLCNWASGNKVETVELKSLKTKLPALNEKMMDAHTAYQKSLPASRHFDLAISNLESDLQHLNHDVENGRSIGKDRFDDLEKNIRYLQKEVVSFANRAIINP